MIGLVLAAGIGKRLGGDGPKCLTDVGGRTILARGVANLVAAGARRIAVVVGYEKESVIGFIKVNLRVQYPDVRFVYPENPRYAETNTARSTEIGFGACAVYDGPVLFLNGDLVFDGPVLKDFNGSKIRYGDSLTVFVDNKRCGEEEVKYTTDGAGRLTYVGKKIPEGAAEGEAIGINFAPAGVRRTFQKYLRDCSADDYFEKAINEMAAAERVETFNIGERFAVEVDFPEDLKTAREWAEQADSY